MQSAENWDAIRNAVRVRDRERCSNCRADGSNVTLDVHHIVPRGQCGSNRMSNLVLLCRQCHDAAHGKRMAPTVEFSSTGQMTDGEFSVYRAFFHNLPSAHFDAERQVWQVPKADVERVIDEISEVSATELAD